MTRFRHVLKTLMIAAEKILKRREIIGLESSMPNEIRKELGMRPPRVCFRRLPLVGSGE